MKKKIAALTIVLCLMSTSAALARGNNYGNHGGGHHNGYQGRSHYSGHRGGGHHNGYQGRSHYSGHRGGGHNNDGLGIAFGIAGGLLLGSALMYSAAPPPPTIVYGTPYTTYQPEVIVQQPRVCVEERIVSGEWRASGYDGRKVWVSFRNPVAERVQVPCY
jgi:hypothetical protein